MVVAVWLAVPCSLSIQGRDFELVFWGQVSLGVGPYIRTGWFEAGKIMLWSRQLWKIEGLPHSCFGVFRYRNGPTDLFPIAWPCCYRIQVHRTNGHFSRSGSLIPRERLLLAKIISRRPIPRSVARNGQHCVFNWDAACRSPLVTFAANHVHYLIHATPFRNPM